MKTSCMIFGNDNDSFYNGFYSWLTMICKDDGIGISYIKRGDINYKTMMEGFGIEITPCVLFFEEDELDENNSKEVGRFYPMISPDEILTLINIQKQNENDEASPAVCEACSTVNRIE